MGQLSGGMRSDFECLFHFSMAFLLANRISPDGRPRSVCLCPIKRTPGLNKLTLMNKFITKQVYIQIVNDHDNGFAWNQNSLVLLD